MFPEFRGLCRRRSGTSGTTRVDMHFKTHQHLSRAMEEQPKARMKARKPYQDASSGSYSISSSWGKDKEAGRKSVKCQTSAEIYEFKEMETQSGRYTNIVQNQVKEKHKGLTLLEHFCKAHKKKTETQWKTAIQDGFVTVDCEVMTDPEIRVDTEFFLEYVEQKVNISTQTVSTATDNLSEESKAGDAEYPGLARFLQRVAPVMTKELEKNASGTDMSMFDFGSSLNAEEGQDANTYWKMLSVDLDARGVVYRDWTGTSYYPASVIKCTVTRNKERIYEIEYKDGSVQSGVKEEYIHVLGDMSTQPKSSARPALTAAQLKEGMRVHAKVALKSGQVKYMPGIITKYTSNRNNRSGGLFEVQCDGRSRAEVDLTVDDILVGLYAGLNIEARMPRKVNLQCTGLSWNATGNILAACYGKNDVDGWCDYPGAVCCWNIFGMSLVPENPDFVLDHPSCLMCVCYHPLIPSIIAAGSFNGEIIVWDLTSPEAPLAVSAITEYSHKTPVLSLNWVCSSVSGRSGASQDPASLDSWLLSSVCTGGKALFWSLKNKLAHPVKGATLPKCKAKSLPGATSTAFLSGGSGSSKAASAPKWMLTGLQGGGILRSPFARMLAGPTLSQESFKTYPPIDEVFLQLRSDDAFAYMPNTGAVTGMQSSPFHRNLFLLSGTDGAVRLFHLLEKQAIRCWEPSPPPGSAGVSGSFSPISAAAFSPSRPLVFAATSSDGFLYVYDLSANPLVPVATLECPLQPPVSTEDGTAAAAQGSSRAHKKVPTKRGGGAESAHNRVTTTGLAFNPKQRGLVAVCDYLGRVHIWKLSWRLSNMRADEQAGLDAIASIYASPEPQASDA